MLKRPFFLYLVIVSTVFFAGCFISGKVVDENGEGMAGVTVTLSGDKARTTTTNSQGNYYFGDLSILDTIPAGNYTVTPSKLGYSFTPASANVIVENHPVGDLEDIPGPRINVNFEGDFTGPAADLSEELTGGSGAFMGEAIPPQLGTYGYVEQEYVAAGTATSYTAAGPLSEDGLWNFEEDETAPYRTRVIVRRPTDPAAFSGTVVVEWLNVSGGVDGNPDYVQMEEEIVRRGHIWVGVSAQIIGVEGGPIIVIAPGGEGLAGKGLKNIDPARYATLEHPGDGFSFDIYTQVARALRQGGPAMGHMVPQRVIAVGESQSAVALVTYYNGVQPLAQAFDGFLVHSRASVSLPLVGPGEFADLTGGMIGAQAAVFRADLEAPILNVQAENDVVGLLDSLAVRQPDSDTFRLWEVAGTAHADSRMLGPEIAEQVDCGAPVNDGPQHFVVKAALNSLERWISTGEQPPVAPRLEVTDTTPPAQCRDADGVALGGIRTPQVDVPVTVLSGEPGPNPEFLCILLGSSIPLSDDRLAELYASVADYEQRYAAAADTVIEAGFVLAEDREALLDEADPSRIPE